MLRSAAIGLLALLALCTVHVAESKATCICTLEYNPVCVKGQTYGNPCEARCDGYKEGDWTMGACGDGAAAAKTRAPCICTLEYNPVCVKGKTYGNPCAARCDGYKEGDWTMGECPKSPSPKRKCICTKIYDPVCYEGKTYGSPCVAKCAGVTKWVAGECGTGRKCACPKIRAPVCAKGKTFANSCLAKCQGYLKYKKGSCGSCICPAIYAPVCVKSIGRTFGNKCTAECQGYFKYTNGACEPPPIKCAPGSSIAKCRGDVCETSESPCAKNPAVTCLINPCSKATYLGTKLTGLQCKPIYVNKTVLKVEKNCNKPLPPLVCAPGSATARCFGNPCELTTSPCKGDDRYVCLVNSCSTITYLGVTLKDAACTAIFVDPLTRKVAKQCIVK
jgi:coxsackievirus/adenovirus receptor